MKKLYLIAIINIIVILNCNAENKQFVFFNENSNDLINNNYAMIKDYKPMIAINASLSATGSLLVLSAVIMGFIPYSSFPDYMKQENYSYSPYIRYPYMTMYTSIGISLFLTGTLLIVISLPFMIYGIVRYSQIKQVPKSTALSMENFPLEISIKLM